MEVVLLEFPQLKEVVDALAQATYPDLADRPPQILRKLSREVESLFFTYLGGYGDDQQQELVEQAENDLVLLTCLLCFDDILSTRQWRLNYPQPAAKVMLFSVTGVIALYFKGGPSGH